MRLAYPVIRSARSIIIDADGGVRLCGWFSIPSPNRPVKGIVIILLGWEDSASSTFCVCTGNRLFRNGYAVFRLNFRDHGSSHDLNTGLFYASAIENFGLQSWYEPLLVELFDGVSRGDHALD